MADNYGASVTEEVNIIFYWKSHQNCQPNECRIRIYWLNEVEIIVLVSNLAVSSSETIADITPEIIYFVCYNFDLLPHKMMLVEHYSFGKLSNDNIYFHVLYAFSEAMSYEISRNKLTQLIGKQI